MNTTSIFYKYYLQNIFVLCVIILLQINTDLHYPYNKILILKFKIDFINYVTDILSGTITINVLSIFLFAYKIQLFECISISDERKPIC